MSEQSTKARIRQKRRKEKTRGYLIGGGLLAVTIGVLAALVWPSVRPAAGQPVEVMPESYHVPEGQDPGPYNTEPPTSGPHYASPLKAGFYDESDAAQMGPYPEGYLLHNLEHGYIIMWYTCSDLDASGCEALKAELQGVVKRARNIKVIAFPRDSIGARVVLTSWGRLQPMETFDASEALSFINSNRNRAPEPQAP